ncbi:ArsR/SmtB family transcription factor [Actinomyces capricornis]|nr:metalloregulator ArsR/SmtB family transcription factor [Actinomyces capricornis]
MSGSMPEPAPVDLLEVLKALGNPARLQIMEWLRDPKTSFAEYEAIADPEEVGVCVTHLAAKSGLAQSTVSTYMSMLERTGMVSSVRVGKWTHYRRQDSRVEEVLSELGRHI